MGKCYDELCTLHNNAREDGEAVAADGYAVTIRTGWLHLPDGDVRPVRDVAGAGVQEPDGAAVSVREWGLIEWTSG